MGRLNGCGHLPARIGIALQTLQVRAHIGGVEVAQVAILFQSLVDNVFELGRKVGIEPDGRRGRTIQNRLEDRGRTFSPERHQTGRHFVKNGSEGKQIRSPIEILAPGLLGGHVSHSANGRAGAGEVLVVHGVSRGVCGRNLAGGNTMGRDFGQSEVENLGMTAVGNKDVGWLDVTMDDALVVSRIEGIGNFDGQGEDGRGFHRASGDLVLQRRALEKLHGNEGLAVLLADVVNRADVGMVQGRRRLSFALEACQCLRVAGNVVGQELESDEAVQARVFRFINHAHATAAKFFDNAIVGNDLADHCKVDYWSVHLMDEKGHSQ
jgi:hypothetical protein